MKLPMIVVLNKADAADKDKVLGWIKNYESLLVTLGMVAASCCLTLCVCLVVTGRVPVA